MTRGQEFFGEAIDVPDWRGIADGLAYALECLLDLPVWDCGIPAEVSARAEGALKARLAAMDVES